MLAYALRRAARTGVLAGGMAGLCLLGALAGLVAGCGGGGAIAPVQSPSQPAIPGRGRDHVVGSGDTLYSIAWRHGLDYRVLAGVNSIRDPYTIYPGQRLLVPEPGDSVPPEPEPATEVRRPVASSRAPSANALCGADVGGRFCRCLNSPPRPRSVPSASPILARLSASDVFAVLPG